MALATGAALAGVSAVATYIDAKFRIREDVQKILSERKAMKSYEQAAKEDRLSLWYLFAKQAAKHPDTQCIWTRMGSYTWQETHDASAQYAQFFLSKGVRPGDLVAFYLQNSAEFMFAWMGLWSIGCAPACVNYNLEGTALIHCLKISGAKLALVDADDSFLQRFEPSRQIVENDLNMGVVILDDSTKDAVSKLPPTVPDDSYRKGMEPTFPGILCYTSGTTGLPKAGPFSVRRCRMGGDHIEPPYECKGGPNGDVWYISMPLFHGTGGMNAYGCMVSGMGLAIGKKFSVSNFWKDVHDSGSTVILYVGETARYLLNAPPGPFDRQHKVRLMHGNGLRPDVWERFRQRFNVPEIAEFFSSTEGNIWLLNHNKGPWSVNAVGSDGLVERWRRHNLAVPVLIDHETGDIYRDPKTGYAQRMPFSTGGEIIVPLPSREAWGGYWKNPEATEKKLISNVFQEGDLYYRTGDALRRSDDGLWFFMDRLGDTFRWKSENVSTAEVSEALGHFPGVSEAIVYGVQLPNHDGRAGCAAILLEPATKSKFDFNALLAHTRSKLPKYAVPVFIRVINETLITGNNKQNKVPLKDEGVEVSKYGSRVQGGEKDRIMWISPNGDRYVDFKSEDWDSLVQGKARL